MANELSGEERLIARYFRPLAKHPAALRLVDDAADGRRCRARRFAARDPTKAGQWGLGRDHQNDLKSRYLLPQPRNVLIEALRAHATAAMDVSDGLAGDLVKLCRASGVAADVDVWRVSLSDAARAARDKEPSLVETILTGGDDYEILATIPADAVPAFFNAALTANVTVTEIGRIAAGEGTARLVGEHGEVLRFARPSFSHF